MPETKDIRECPTRADGSATLLAHRVSKAKCQSPIGETKREEDGRGHERESGEPGAQLLECVRARRRVG